MNVAPTWESALGACFLAGDAPFLSVAYVEPMDRVIGRDNGKFLVMSPDGSMRLVDEEPQAVKPEAKAVKPAKDAKIEDKAVKPEKAEQK